MALSPIQRRLLQDQLQQRLDTTLPPNRRDALQTQLATKLKARRTPRKGMAAKLLRGEELEQQLKPELQKLAKEKTAEIQKQIQTAIATFDNRLQTEFTKAVENLEEKVLLAIANLPRPRDGVDGNSIDRAEIATMVTDIVQKTVTQSAQGVSLDNEADRNRLVALIEEVTKEQVKTAPRPIFGGGGGVTYFHQIKDVPRKTPGTGATYAGNEGKALLVSADGKRLEFGDVQTAGGTAETTTYDNTASGLTATNVQEAIDEVVTLTPEVTLKWSDYALNGLITNTTVIATGEVLTITLNSTNYYRYYTTDTDANGYPVIDAIYSSFDGTNVPTGLLAQRGEATGNEAVPPSGGGGGTVTSVAVTGSDGIEVDSGSPITTTGTIVLGINATTMRTHLNVENGAEVNNISDTNATDLTDGGDSTLHFHSADRNRANHTGTQLASTISDLETTITNNSAVLANTAKMTNATHTGDVTGATVLTIANGAVTEAKTSPSVQASLALANTAVQPAALHDPVTLAGAPDYLTIAGQVITRALINLTTHVTNRLPFANLATLSAHQVLGRAGTGTGDAAGITMNNDSILGRAGSGDVSSLSASQVRTILNVADGSTAYTDEQAQDATGAMATNSTFVNLTYDDTTPSLTPALSATGTPSATTFLRGDNTWAVPAGGATTEALTLIPKPNFWVGDSANNATSNSIYNSSTSMRLTQVIVDRPITINKISFRVSSASTSGTLDICLYSEDGQAQLFAHTTGTISVAGVQVETLGTPVTVPAGVYYVTTNTNGSAVINIQSWNALDSAFSTTGLLSVTGEPILNGILTITAGTPPTTFDPTTITVQSVGAPALRFDN